MNSELAAELARMVEDDQRVRLALDLPSVEMVMEMARVDVANTDRLRAIVDEHGWPGRSLVGEEGAENAWLLAQHAVAQLDFQRRALALLTEAVAAGEATPTQLAYLTDRVRIAEGQEQIYGTQLVGGEDGHLVPHPIENADLVDERRAQIGLEPIAEYLQTATRYFWEHS